MLQITATFLMARMKKRVSRGKRTVKRRHGKGSSKTFVTTLRRLSSLQPSQRVQAMKSANDKFIRQFCNSVKKLRHQPVSSKTLKQLRRQSLKLRKLVSAKTSINTKRRMLSQRGGFLPMLLAPIISALAGTIISAIRR